jgi:phosphatidylserine decarboxylase
VEPKTKRNILIGIGIAVTITSVYLLYKYRFLRLPARNIPNDPNLFVSPANGKIVAIRRFIDEVIIESKYDKEDNIDGAISLFGSDISPTGTIISIHMNLNNVHYQRVPVDSRVLAVKHTKGDFNNALTVKGETFIRHENEHNEVLFQTNSGIKYKVVQIAGFLARRIECFVQAGQNLKQGDVFGVIKMGSQVTVLVPDNVQITANVGDIVLDGETVLGTIKTYQK